MTRIADIELQKGTIVNPDGSIINRPTLQFSPEDALLLRDYKQFLQRHRLREALFCQDCWEGDIADGCKAFVTSTKIGIICRCRSRVFLGQTL